MDELIFAQMGDICQKLDTLTQAVQIIAGKLGGDRLDVPYKHVVFDDGHGEFIQTDNDG